MRFRGGDLQKIDLELVQRTWDQLRARMRLHHKAALLPALVADMEWAFRFTKTLPEPAKPTVEFIIDLLPSSVANEVHNKLLEKLEKGETDARYPN